MKKSENTTGNPYHDDEGKFTSKDGIGGGSVEVEMPKIQLKPGVDLSGITTAIQNVTPINHEVDTSTPLTMPSSIQDAEMQGNRILGSSGAVGYAANTDLRVAHEFNRALFDVVSDFPKLFDSEQLYLYGTEDKRVYGSDKQTVRSNERVLISSVLSNPVYATRLQELQMSQNDIMDIMTRALHIAKKTFGEDPEVGCGGFTKMSDYDDKTHTINTHNVIKFNTHYSTDINKWIKYPQEAIRQGHFLPIGNENGAYMVGTHEIGHHVFEKLIDLMDRGEKAQLKKVMWAETGGVQDPKKLRRMGMISGYAETNRHEHIAEAFANVYCAKDNATQHNKNIVLFLKGVYNRIYGNK